MKYRTWIEPDDIVVAEPWDWQDEKATIEWRYTGQDADPGCVAKATSIEPGIGSAFN